MFFSFVTEPISKKFASENWKTDARTFVGKSFLILWFLNSVQKSYVIAKAAVLGLCSYSLPPWRAVLDFKLTERPLMTWHTFLIPNFFRKYIIEQKWYRYGMSKNWSPAKTVLRAKIDHWAKIRAASLCKMSHFQIFILWIIFILP
jgi:hypothetical protein